MLSATTIQRSNVMLTFILVTVAFFLLFDSAQATFKKPPFNGSIFGKRTTVISDYEGTARTLSSLCEIAVETCSIWLPQIEAAKK